MSLPAFSIESGLNGAQSSGPPHKWAFELGQTSNASWAEV
jgi:hypothetical protein